MPERVRFFPGQVLSANDFQVEQAYQIKMRRLHNQLLHGSGVVEGLSVSIDNAAPASLTVSPGFALDPLGREIIVDLAARVSLAGFTASVYFLALAYNETATAPVPLPNNHSEFSRVVEGFLITLVTVDPRNSTTNAVALAKLNNLNGSWHLDGSYQVKRIKTGA